MSDLFDPRALTMTLINGSLTGLSGAAKTISYTSNPTFLINGRFYTGDTCSGGALETLDEFTGEAYNSMVNGQGSLFVFTWDTAGEWHVCQGPVVKTADVANGSAAYAFPSIPANQCPFAYVTISNAHATTTWTFGTDNWNAATPTIGTVVNCSMLPTQPLTAASA